MAQAQGDGQRFKLLLAEYQRAPQVTRDRLYLESMQQVYSSVTKILVESRQGSNMLFLPLEKILQQVSQGGAAAPAPEAAPAAPAAPGTAVPPSSGGDARTRDNSRGRERESR